jgi:hypothetical protein
VGFSIDQNGRVFDQGTATNEYEAQILTDRMMEDLASATPTHLRRL